MLTSARTVIGMVLAVVGATVGIAATSPLVALASSHYADEFGKVGKADMPKTTAWAGFSNYEPRNGMYFPARNVYREPENSTVTQNIWIHYVVKKQDPSCSNYSSNPSLQVIMCGRNWFTYKDQWYGFSVAPNYYIPMPGWGTPVDNGNFRAEVSVWWTTDSNQVIGRQVFTYDDALDYDYLGTCRPQHDDGAGGSYVVME